MKRHAYTLIEIVVAMLAASVLVASLAGSIAVTSSLLQPDTDHDKDLARRLIADRIGGDLRYATSATAAPSGVGLDLHRTEPASNINQVIRYRSESADLTRGVDGDTAVRIGASITQLDTTIDGYSAPTWIATSPNLVRCRSRAVQSSADSVSSISVEIPAGVIPGDLVLLCVSAKSSSTVAITKPNSFTTLQDESNGYLSLVVAYGAYDLTWPTEITIDASPIAYMAATLITVEGVDPGGPIRWTANRRNASPFADLAPTSLESATTQDSDLNLQIFAADRSPWFPGTMGMASYVDVVQRRAGESSFWFGNSIGVASRNGNETTLSSPPQMMHRSYGSWIQAAVVLKGLP
ncbi:hypothetical protein Poly51_24420 [Rubripirellula tenax]|uniref:Prepilin-type N-terminal cleavage/methylation domain-containing protein n=1 Tax=Rubripirellula tenax TaxID=2528015 RepID=A0A5C6FAF8_9BACT|nr:hypothetical protein [Rubripirellula tenax]TWU56531.1 hypothetical protein Poly51_24420 [Rubripirellula tenax]